MLTLNLTHTQTCFPADLSTHSNITCHVKGTSNKQRHTRINIFVVGKFTQKYIEFIEYMLTRVIPTLYFGVAEQLVNLVLIMNLSLY